MNNVWLAFLLTAIAGLSTGIGSIIALTSKKTNKKFLSVVLGFSAGVMIYVSLVEIFADSQRLLIQEHGNKAGLLLASISFFGGMLIIGLIDKFIPAKDNPNEMQNLTDFDKEACSVEHKKRKILRSGIMAAIAIAIHNFPEGLATFISALQEPKVAIPIVVAIAIHNIPEGIAISVPIFYATCNKKKAFILSFLSGFSELLGAVIGYFVLMPFLNDTVMGIIFGIVAGIMVFISFDELLPSAREFGEHHLSLYGLILGMVVMALSIWLFA